MPCECCPANRTLYDPACLRCGRRYVRDVKRRSDLSVEVRRKWLVSIADTWVKHGHDVEQLRLQWGELDGDSGH